MIKVLPPSWQASWWCWRYGTTIEAIKHLRKSSGLPLKDAKALVDRIRNDKEVKE